MFSSLLSKSDVKKPSSHQSGGGKIDVHAARKKAVQTCTAQHNLVKPFQEQVVQCKTSQYWNYGYRLSTALALFGTNFALAQRFPAVGGAGSIVAVLGGFYVGGIAHQIHITWLQAKLIAQIDKSMEVLEKADVEKGSNVGVPEYREALDVLVKMKQQEVADRMNTSAFLSGFGLGGAVGEAGNGSPAGMQAVAYQQQAGADGQVVDPLDVEVHRIIADFQRRQQIKKGMSS